MPPKTPNKKQGVLKLGKQSSSSASNDPVPTSTFSFDGLVRPTGVIGECPPDAIVPFATEIVATPGMVSAFLQHNSAQCGKNAAAAAAALAKKDEVLTNIVSFMTAFPHAWIKLTDVSTDDEIKLRPLHASGVDMIKQAILEHGYLGDKPVTVKLHSDPSKGFVLVDGRHRVSALRALSSQCEKPDVFVPARVLISGGDVAVYQRIGIGM